MLQFSEPMPAAVNPSVLSLEDLVKDLMGIREKLWNDPQMEPVRYWINYQSAYVEMEPLLQKRCEIDLGKRDSAELTGEESTKLDQLDRFYTLVKELRAVEQRLTQSQIRLGKLDNVSVKYWVERSQRDDRPMLAWYVSRFHPELAYDTLKRGKYQKFN